MLIGGVQPVTLLDYPQKVAAIVFTKGCNFRCSFCYNPDLVLADLIAKRETITTEWVMDFLQGRKKYLDGVVITGGEPTIHQDLPEFCRAIKALGYEIKLDTNGTNPDMLQSLYEQSLIDYVAMDIKAPLEKYQEIVHVEVDQVAISRSIELIKSSGVPYEFRSTLVPGFHQPEDVAAMAQAVAGAERYYLQNFQAHEQHVGDNEGRHSFTSREMQVFCDQAMPHVVSCAVR